jgi:hypothetical protein
MRIRRAVLILALFSVSTLCFGAAPKQLAELTASDGTPSDSFGGAVAVSGNVVVVGAPEATVGGNNQEGAAYVFVKPAGGWTNMTQVAKLTPTDGFPEEYFGSLVAVSGSTIVVGPFIFEKPTGGWRDMNETVALNRCSGAVALAGSTLVCGAEVFLKPKGGWVADQEPAATLSEANPVKGDNFGYPVAISDNTIVVGAVEEGGPVAYVYVKPARGWTSMTETAKLTESDGTSADCGYGCSLAINGSSVVVGAPDHRSGGGPSYTGVAYVFAKPSSGWSDMTQTAELTDENGTFNNQMGRSVAIAGRKVVAGAPYGGNNENEGAAYLYQKSKNGWETTSDPTAQLLPSDPIAGNSFAFSVAMSGGTIVVGATKLPISPGAAYVF